MKNLKYIVPFVLPLSLHTEIEGVIGDLLYGVSTNNENVTVHIKDDSTSLDWDAVTLVINEHDPVNLMASREGTIVTIVLSKPRNLDSVTEVTLLCDGIPHVVTLNTPIQITDEIGDTQKMILTVDGYPCNVVEV